jgi:alkylhydroperoxidase family enzyme
MARVPYPTAESFSDEDRIVFDRVMDARGRPVAHVWAAIANAPKLLEAVSGMAAALRERTSIARKLRELAVLMVGLEMKSAYEFDHHWNAALDAGLTRDQLQSMRDFEGTSLFDDQERAVLRYASEATRTGQVEDATWTALRHHFPLEQCMEIVLTVAWYNCVVRILLPLEIEHEPWFQRR